MKDGNVMKVVRVMKPVVYEIEDGTKKPSLRGFHAYYASSVPSNDWRRQDVDADRSQVSCAL